MILSFMSLGALFITSSGLPIPSKGTSPPITHKSPAAGTETLAFNALTSS